ncbi:MAG: alginate lyase family protein [Candidatus Thiodiazotropha endolucinida]
MSGFLWKLNRLRTMGQAEVLYRLRHAAQALWEGYGLGLAKPDKPDGLYGKAWLEALPSDFDVAAYRKAAERVLTGRFDIFALKNTALGFPPDWNRDPVTSTASPLVFGKTLNYRDENIVGNIKYLWEPNRHLELVSLAQAFRLSSQKKYAEGVRMLLETWFEQCPYPLGVNWTSSLEHAVRIVNWSFTWYLLGAQQSNILQGEAGASFKRHWLDSVYQHLHFIHGHLSKYSSANNHLLGEYMGLFIGSVTWPLWKESEKWKALSKKGFEEEVLKQNYSDGVNKEQGIWYHHEVADMMLLCGLVGKANGIEFSSAYWERLEGMFDYIASIMDVNGNVPMFGDSDDAVMVRFSQEDDFNVYRSLLATGAVLFNRAKFKRKAIKFDDKSRWLLGEKGEEVFCLLDTSNETDEHHLSFPEGGYYILGKKLNLENEIRCVVDAGPLGYLSIAAHGHADALSIILAVAGNEILIDPGTYAYHTKKEWRGYFKGTSAHNTIEVDGLDQSVSGGNFLWLNHANTQCHQFTSSELKDYFKGSHDGYMRLKDPVSHSREISLEKNTNNLSVIDQIGCMSEHMIAMHWHFSEYCHVQFLQDHTVQIVNGSVSIIMTVDKQLEAQLISGQVSPPLGWTSRSFDYKTPIQTLRLSGKISGNSSFKTHFKITI